MELNMFANYNENGLSYPVYRPARGEISEPVTIIIPEDWECYESESGSMVIVTPDGQKNMDYEVQTQPDGRAYFFGPRGNYHYVEVRR